MGRFFLVTTKVMVWKLVLVLVGVSAHKPHHVPVSVIESRVSNLEKEIASLEEISENLFDPEGIVMGHPDPKGLIQPVCKPSLRNKGYFDFITVSGTHREEVAFTCGCVCSVTTQASSGTCFTCPQGTLEYDDDQGSYLCKFCPPGTTANSEKRCVSSVSKQDQYKLQCPEGSVARATTKRVGSADVPAVECVSSCHESGRVIQETQFLDETECGWQEVRIPGAVIDDATAFEVKHTLICALPEDADVDTTQPVITKYIVVGNDAKDSVSNSDTILGIRCYYSRKSTTVLQRVGEVPKCERGTQEIVRNGVLYCFLSRPCPDQFHTEASCGPNRPDLIAAMSSQIAEKLLSIPGPATKLTTSQNTEIDSISDPDEQFYAIQHYLAPPRSKFYSIANRMVRCYTAFFQLSQCLGYAEALKQPKKSDIQVENVKLAKEAYGFQCGSLKKPITRDAMTPPFDYASKITLVTSTHKQAKASFGRKSLEGSGQCVREGNCDQSPYSHKTPLVKDVNIVDELASNFASLVQPIFYACVDLDKDCIESAHNPPRLGFRARKYREVAGSTTSDCPSRIGSKLAEGKSIGDCVARSLQDWTDYRTSAISLSDAKARRGNDW